MRLYFTDPTGARLAIETDLKQWCCDYVKPGTPIDDDHRFIKVQSLEDLYHIEDEADFCGWSYGDSWLTGQEIDKETDDENAVPLF